MPASACLRISLDLSDDKLSKLDAIGPLVAKVTAAFLDSRWRWPKTFVVESPFCFTLTDPKATEMDVVALEHLAEELQLKLFGTSQTGEVTLLLLEADVADSRAFINMSHAEIRDVFREPLKATPFAGRLLSVNANRAPANGMKWRTLVRDRLIGIGETAEAPVLGAELRGIYFTPRQSFIGSAVSAAYRGEPAEFSLVDGVDRLPRDQAESYDVNSLEAGLHCLKATEFTGVLFLPICYSALTRRSTREYYDEVLQTVPLDRRNQLAVSVYDVPRSPNFWGLNQMHDLLAGHFASIDLQVEDPGFEVDNVPPGSVSSITYRLPMTDERSRLKAAKDFMRQRDTFKRLKIWPAITNVATPAELRLCLLERTPFITGRAVCGPMTSPVGSQLWGIDALPYKHAA